MTGARARGWLAALMLLGLYACTPTPPRPSPPPTVVPPPAAPTTPVPGAPADLISIPDAIPRDEPRSILGNPPFYIVDGRRYVVLPDSAGFVERGVASWYGADFHGLKTSTGESYDMFAMTAAHKTLPLPCYARVTNLTNGRSVVVRINDRGPFVANRIIDLSYTAAVKLDMVRNGTAFVQVETLTPSSPIPTALPATAPDTTAARVSITSVPPVMPATPPPNDSTNTTASAVATSTAAAGSAANPTTPATVSAPPPAASHVFYIQVGAYANADNAERTAQRLRAAGLPQVTAMPPDARQLQRVRIGPVQSVQQFDALIAKLNALGFRDARLAQD